MSRSPHLPLLAVLALPFSACSGYTSTIGPEHCGVIDGDQVWGRDLNPHEVSCNVTIAGNLTVGPGVRVRFAPGTLLIVQGSLSVEGTAEDPVEFIQAEAGRGWAGVWVRPFEPQDVKMHPNPEQNPARALQGDVRLRHLSIEGAGLTPEGLGLQPAALIIDRAPVELSDVTVDGSLQCGISLGRQGRLAEESENIAIAGSTLAPICAHPAAVGSLPDSLELDDGVSIDVLEGALGGTHTWRNLGDVPYRLVGDLGIFRAELTLEAGITVAVLPDVRVAVGAPVDGPIFGIAPFEGPSFRRMQGSYLHLAGTPSSPVTLTVAETGASTSYWGGLVVDGAEGETSVILENAVIEAAGAGLTSVPAALTMTRSARVTVDGVTIQGSGGAGVAIADQAAFTGDSRALTVTGNAYAAVLAPDAMFSLPGDGSSYTGNGGIEPTAGARLPGDRVYVTPGQITRSGLLRDIDIPYDVEGSVRVSSTAEQPVDLEIEPGVELRFAPRAGLSIGTRGPSSLSAGSVTGDPIVLSGDPSAPEGARAWAGLELGAELQDGAVLHNVALLDAGLDDGQALLVGSRAFDLVDVTLQAPDLDGGVTTGLRLVGTFSETSRGLTVRGADVAVESQIDSVASIPEEGADLADNAGAYVLSDGNRLTVGGTWGDLGVPYRVEDTVFIRGIVDEEQRIHPARLTVEPGVTVTFSRTASFRTERFGNELGDFGHGTIAAVGTTSAPVVFTAAVPTDGWTGLIFSDEDVRLEAIGDGVPAYFPIEERSVLRNVIVEHGAALFSFANITYDNATLDVDNVVSRFSKRYGLSLIRDAYTRPYDPPQPPNRCDLFTRDPYTFEGNAGGDVGGDEDDVIDFRVFVDDCG